MKTTYFTEDDTLVIRLSDKPITKEVSQEWNFYISYAADGKIDELVILEAKANGILPTHIIHHV